MPRLPSPKITVGRIIISELLDFACHARNSFSAAYLVRPYSLNGLILPSSLVPGSLNPYTATELVKIILLMSFSLQTLDILIAPSTFVFLYSDKSRISSLWTAAKLTMIFPVMFWRRLSISLTSPILQFLGNWLKTKTMKKLYHLCLF